MKENAVDCKPFTLDLGEELFLRGDVRTGPKEGPGPVLIVAHGFKGFKDWGMFPYVSESFARRGYTVITFNFSCNGVNETDFDELDKFAVNTFSREQADLEALLAAAADKRLPDAERMNLDHLFLIGHSRGGGNAILFAAEHAEVKGVVSWNGISDCNLFGAAFREQVLRDGVGYVENARTHQQMPIAAVVFEDLNRNPERFDIIAAAAGLPVPILFIQGDRDARRLLTGFARLQEAAPEKSYVTIEGANHTFGAVHPFAGTTDHLEKAVAVTAGFLDSIR